MFLTKNDCIDYTACVTIMNLGLYDNGYISEPIPNFFTYEAYEYLYKSVCKNITYGDNRTLMHPKISSQFYYWIKDSFEKRCDPKNILTPYKLNSFEIEDKRYLNYSKKRYTVYIYYTNHQYPKIQWVDHTDEIMFDKIYVSKHEIYKGHFVDRFPPRNIFSNNNLD